MLHPKSEYLLQFNVEEGLLFSDMLVMHTYGTYGVAEVYSNGILREYIHKSAIEKAYPTGLDLYSSKEKTEKFFTSLQLTFDHIFEEYDAIIQKPLSQEMLRAFTDLSQEVLMGYTMLDPLFTDKLYLHAKENEILAENMEHINQKKDLFRETISNLFLDNGNYIHRLIKLFSNHFSIPFEDLRWYRQEDLENLFNGSQLSEDGIKDRQHAFVQIGSEDGVESFYGEEAVNMIQEFDTNLSADADIITGKVASISTKPVVRGIVRIINADYKHPEEVVKKMQSMNKGDILVASTTSPNRMVACMKAAAIITDVGGVLSHAAIVSRELDIPCIVGTENASKILHDGDMVEVNTNKGIVTRILN